MILYDYQCGRCCAVHEALESRPAPSSRPCPECGGDAVRVFCAPKVRTVWGYAASMGKSQDPPPGAFDTRALAEGQSYREWRAERRKGRRDEAREGLVDRKVYL